MEYVDALYELKRSKRKCNEVNNGLEDFKRLLNDKDDRDSHYQEFLGFIWDNAERESDDKRKRDDYDEENDPTHEDQPVKRNKRLEIKIKVEGQKAGTSNPVPEKPCERVQLGVKGKTHSQKKRDDYDEENDPTHEDQPVKRNKRLEIKIKVEGQKAGTSNPVEMSEQESGGSNSVSEIMSERSSPTQQDLKAKRKKPNKFKGVKEDQPVEKNKTLEIQIKVEGSKAGTSNPVSKLGVKAKTQQKMKFARVTQIDDGDEDSNIPSDQPRPKDKGGSVISENPEAEILDDYPFLKGVKEDQPVEKNKTLEIQIKVEGSKAGTGNPVSKLGVKAETQQKMKFARVIQIDDDDEDSNIPSDQPRPKDKGGSVISENPEVEILDDYPFLKGVKEDQPVEKNKTLEIQIKVEGSKAGMGNPVSKLGMKAETQQKMKFARVIQIDDDDEDSNIPSDQPRPKDKGGSVISENPEVEILDDYTFFKHGIVSPFVSSKKYHENVLDDDAENAVFRNDVLKVLRKPFDVEEYDRLKEAMKAGSYLDRHEDVNTVLQSRCKPEKQLAILRGFFFWLQNLTRKGAFRPWIDRVCLEVVPAHEDEN